MCANNRKNIMAAKEVSTPSPDCIAEGMALSTS